MAIMRTKSRLTLPAPPPSPIPTGTGSRSAANEIFNEFIEKSIQPPNLSLPEIRFLSGANPVPAVIDYRSLESPRADEAVDRILRSVKEFGAFRIVNHGVSGEEILSLMNEAKFAFEKSVEKDEEFEKNDENREAMLQVRYRSDGETSKNPVHLTETYRYMSEKMENIGSKLKAIGEEISGILSKNMGGDGDQFLEKIKKEEKESILTLYKYNHQNHFMGNPLPNKGKKGKENDNAMIISLQISGEHCQFYVIPDEEEEVEGPSCFDATADTIVVTIGKQLQEWSQRRLKSARSEMVFAPDLLGNLASFSIELKFSHTNSLHHQYDSHSFKVISIFDQILIAFLLAFLYFFYTYISSLF